MPALALLTKNQTNQPNDLVASATGFERVRNFKINNDDIDKREINNNTRQIEGKLTLHKVSCGVLTINRVRFHNPPLLLTKARTVSFLALCSHSDLDSVPVKY